MRNRISLLLVAILSLVAFHSEGSSQGEQKVKPSTGPGPVAVLASTSVTAVTAAAQGTTMTWTIEGETREALVFAPAPERRGDKHPLVFAFHGHGGNMQGTSQLMHIHTLWPKAIVVYPQGVNRPSPVDPNGTKPGWQVEANQANINNADLKFFDAMVARMHGEYSIDDARIYVTGFSNGAIFSYLLWAERGKLLAAIGDCAGRLWQGEHLTQPRPVLVIAGRADTTDPFALQEKSIKIARRIDNASNRGQVCGQYCTFYPSTTHTPVKTFIHPGAHVYPAWAPGEIVTFFKAHKRTYLSSEF